MKKVLFIMPTLETGGAEKVLVTVLNNLDLSKYDITLLTIYNYTSTNNILNNGIKRVSFIKSKSRIVHSISYKLFCKLLSSKTLYKLMVKEQFDTEIAFLEGLPTKIISGSTNTKSKKIAWVHTDLNRFRDSDYCFKSEKKQKECYSNFDNIIAVSEGVKTSFLGRFTDSNEVRTIYNPIDSKLVQEMSEIPIEFPFINKGFHFVAIGRLAKEKGFDRLLEACYILKNKHYMFDLCIIGEGYQHRYLDELIEKYELKNHVCLYGYTDNPYRIIRLCDAVVVSSFVEGLPTVVIESLILGKPVVATDVTGINEVLENGKWGLLVDSNVASIAEGMAKMMEKSSLEKYKELAAKRGFNFSLKESIDKISSVL